MPKCDFNRVAMHLCWGHTLVWVFCEFAPNFQGTSLWEHQNMSFAKVLLSLVVQLKAHLHTANTVLSMTYRFLIFYNFY